MRNHEERSLVDKIKAFAESQANQDAPEIYFEFNGQAITNPWLDPSGRFEQDTKAAIEMYGKDNVSAFLCQAGYKILDEEIEKERKIKNA